MKIIKLQATFGCLEQATLELQPGLQVLTGPNGSGKSTWSAFLLAMLYGLEGGRRASKDSLPEAQRFAPWSGKPMAGRMELEWQGQEITLLRSSQGKGSFNQFRAYDSRTGREIPGLTGENCGEKLLGVPRAVYARSGFLAQGQMIVTGDASLEQRLSALVSTGELGISRAEAQAALRKYKNRLWHNKTGRIPQVQQQLAAQRQTLAAVEGSLSRLQALQAEERALRQQLAQAREEAAQQQQAQAQALQAQLEQAQQQAQAAAESEERLRRQLQALPPAPALAQLAQEIAAWQQAQATGAPKAKAGLGALLLLLLALGAGLLLPPWGWMALLLPALALARTCHQRRRQRTAWKGAQDARRAALLAQANALAPCNTLEEALEALRQAQALPAQHARQLALAKASATAAHTLANALAQQPAAMGGQSAALQQALQENAAQQARCQGALEAAQGSDGLAALQAQCQQLEAELAQLQRQYLAAQRALEALEQAGAQLEARFAPQLCSRTTALFARLTHGQYDRVLVDRDMSMLVRAQGQLEERRTLTLSLGTAQQLALCLRLAIWELLVPEGPLVLDDALVNFDQARLEAAMTLLRELGRERQIVLFTCTGREQQA